VLAYIECRAAASTVMVIATKTARSGQAGASYGRHYKYAVLL
jgi:hypothetical protein